MASKLIPLWLILMLFLNPLSVFAQDENGYPVYIIREGDSLGSIADLFDTTLTDILEINNISNPDLISPGQSLNIPGLQGVSGILQIVTPQLGESLSILSTRYGVDIDVITSINHLLSPTGVFPGSTIIIPLRSITKPLIPVSSIQPNETGLESAVLTGKNPHTLNIQNQMMNNNLAFSGKIVFTDDSENAHAINLFAPLIDEVRLYPLPLVQGATEVVSVRSNFPLNLKGNLGNHELTFYNEAVGQYYALQGIYALAEPGLVEFNLIATIDDGSEHTYKQMVLLNPGNFDEDPPLMVDPKTIDPAVTEPENELVFSLITKKTPVKYWTDVFKSPAVYQEFNSLFGTRRWYNDDPEARFHGGVDFAGGLTLPIIAPAPGLVVFSGPLTVRGNAVFIDHGWGVFSGFFHQDTLNVKVGDRVATGDVIGTVGNTGRVNGSGDYYGAGAHLHWELWVNQVQVDPLDWLDEKYP